MKIILTVILLAFVCSSLPAQIKISGKVTGKSSEALPSANVYLKDTYDGASTATDGTYSFTTTETGEKTLVVSFIGYKTQERKLILNGKDIKEDFILEEEASSTKTVVVSAGTFEASDENKAVILRPLDIVTTGSTADIYSALNTLPGTQQIGNTEGLFVRGGSAAESKTIIDEMVVQKPFESTVPDVASRGRFSPMLFKGTIFSSGGYSAQYGQALSSALILKSQDLAPDTRSGISIMAVGLGASHQQRWENTSLSGEIGYFDLTPYYKLQKQRLDWTRAPMGEAGSIIFRHKLSQTGMLKAYSSLSVGDLSLNMKNLDNLNAMDKYRLRNSNFLLNSSYNDIFGQDWTFFSGVAYSRDVDNVDWNSDKIESATDLLQSKVTVAKHIFDGSFLTFGAEVQNRIFQDNFNQYDRKLNEVYAAGFAETDVFFTNDIAARVGLRIENTDLINKANIAPRLSFAYRLGKDDQINFSYGQFYETPEKEFLFQTRDLNFEKATHYILNYQYLGSNITFRVEGYYKEYKDLVKNNSAITAQYDNSGKGYAKGIDVFFRNQGFINNNSDAWISYSYLDTKRDYRDFPTLATPDFAAEHTFSLVYKQYVAAVPALFGLTYTFASGRPYYNPNNPVFMVDRTKNYQNLSLNMSYLTNIFGQFTVVFVSVDNVFAIENIFTYRYSSDGRVSEPIVATASRFAFLGIFISLGENTTGF